MTDLAGRPRSPVSSVPYRLTVRLGFCTMDPVPMRLRQATRRYEVQAIVLIFTQSVMYAVNILLPQSTALLAGRAQTAL